MNESSTAAGRLSN